MNRSTFLKTLFGLTLAPFVPVHKKPTTYKFMSPDVLLGGTSWIQENCHRSYSISRDPVNSFEYVDRSFTGNSIYHPGTGFFEYADTQNMYLFDSQKLTMGKLSKMFVELEKTKKYLSTMK